MQNDLTSGTTTNKAVSNLPEIQSLHISNNNEDHQHHHEHQQHPSSSHLHHSFDNLTPSRRDNSPSYRLNDFNERGRTNTPSAYHYEPGKMNPRKSQSSSRCTSLPTQQDMRIPHPSHYHLQNNAASQQQHMDNRNPHSLSVPNHQPRYASMPPMLYGVSPHSLPSSHPPPPPPPNSTYPSYNYPPNDMNYHHRQPMSLPQPLMYQYWSYPSYVGQGGVAANPTPAPHSMPLQPPNNSYKAQSYRPEASDAHRTSGRSKQTRQQQSSSSSNNNEAEGFISPADKRYNIYKNLCGLFPKDVVETVMSSHPDIIETKKLVKLCLGDS